MRLIISFSILILIIFSCAKNKPKKFILGQWEVVNIDSKEIRDNNPQIWLDFKKDLSYFKNITFYEDSIFFIDYINAESRQGIYYFDKADFNSIFTSHFSLKDTTQQQKFNFSYARYDIKKITRNKLIVTTDYLPGNDLFYKKLTLTFSKTGKFE